jgi:hypothetical protein
MRTIQYVPTGRKFDRQHLPADVRLNSKGEIEGVDYRAGRDGNLLVAQALKGTSGLEILNATGDINADAMGYQIVLDTLTYIKKQVTEQVFYEINFPDFVPTAVGDGAFSAALLTNLTFAVADDFESGNIRTGTGNDRLSEVDTTIASKTVAVINWAKNIGYSIFDINQALVANNWDIIMSKESSRMKNWQLGLQKIAFLGSLNNTGVAGLLNNSSVNINTSLITAPISGLNAANFATFVQTLISTYWTNTNSTKLPTHFVMPSVDWLGLTVLVPGSAGTFPVPMIDYLEMAFKKLCGPNFKILMSAYGDPANNAAYLGGGGKHVYALYRHDPESIRMDVPVNYTVTQPNSLNNFQFQNVAYGQYTGVGFYRNLETLLFQY